MSLLDKAKFWKHDDLDLDTELPPLDPANDPTGMGDVGMPKDSPDMEQLGKSWEPDIGGRDPRGLAAPQQQQQMMDPNKDFDLLSSKLDAIKAVLDSMDQRIRRIENLAEGEKGEDGKFTNRDPWAKY
ncbi:hypothetical protein ACFL1B_00365 [Nanoarchaeota archaeon]